MTNLYLSKEVYEKIDDLGEKLQGEYKHPVDDDLIIIHPAYPYTFDNHAISCIKIYDNDCLEGYVDVFKGNTPKRFTIPPTRPIEISQEQMRLHAMQDRSDNDKVFYIVSNIFYMGMCAVVAINEGHFNKETTKRPKIWKRHRKRYKSQCKYDSHFLVKIGKTHQQDNPDSLSNSVEQRHHMRRGHWRFIKSRGERIWIKPYWAGNKDLGTINKDYKR